MECLICKRSFNIGDEILKLIHSRILGDQTFEFHSILEHGIIHINCLNNLSTHSLAENKKPSVERSNILDFLE